MGIDELFDEMPDTIEFLGDTYAKDNKILGYGENVAVAYFQQGGKGAVMSFYNQGQIIYTPDGQDIQLICVLDNGVTAETVLDGIKRGEMFVNKRKVKGMRKSVRKAGPIARGLEYENGFYEYYDTIDEVIRALADHILSCIYGMSDEEAVAMARDMFADKPELVERPGNYDDETVIYGCYLCEDDMLGGVVYFEEYQMDVEESARKMKKLYEFNDSRYEAFKYAFDSEWRMLCMRNEGVTHEETQLDDRNFVAVVRCPQEPLPDFELEAFIGSLERMGFKLDYYTDGPYEDGLIYEFYAKDNQTHGYESLLDEPVEVVDGKHDNHYTLREAIEVFGISSEPYNLDDARVFARCPYLKGLCGPMAPNSGYVARYETQEVCDFLSVSRRKSTRKIRKSGWAYSESEGAYIAEINGHECRVEWDGGATYTAIYDDWDDRWAKDFRDIDDAKRWLREVAMNTGIRFNDDGDVEDGVYLASTRKSIHKSFKTVYNKQRDKHGKVIY